MEFRELSDGEWDAIKPFLPPKAGFGTCELSIDVTYVSGLAFSNHAPFTGHIFKQNSFSTINYYYLSGDII